MDEERKVEKVKRGTIPFFPFSQMMDRCFGKPYPFFVRKGELTLLAGNTGCGKSLLMTQIALHLAQRGAEVAIFPLDNGKELTFKRMLSQCLFRSWEPKHEDGTILQAIDKIEKVTISPLRGLVWNNTIRFAITEFAKTKQAETKIVF